MSAYRESACLFCEAPSTQECPRCRAPVCASHGLATVGAPHRRAWCATCAKELADDLDVARFAIDVHELPPDSGALFRGRANAALADVVAGAVAGVRGWFVRRRVRRTFDARTPEQIDAWRRAAGVRMRA